MLAQEGGPYHRARGYLLSQPLTKAFQASRPLLSNNPHIHDLRHSFESGVLEAK